MRDSLRAERTRLWKRLRNYDRAIRELDDALLFCILAIGGETAIVLLGNQAALDDANGSRFDSCRVGQMAPKKTKKRR